MPIDLLQPWNSTSPRYAVLTHTKNIASATHYTAFLTPADYSTYTTKPHSSLKATVCPLSITASSFAPPQLTGLEPQPQHGRHGHHHSAQASTQFICSLPIAQGQRAQTHPSLPTSPQGLGSHSSTYGPLYLPTTIRYPPISDLKSPGYHDSSRIARWDPEQ